MNLEQHFLAFS